MALRKFGTGEVLSTEETDTTKKVASKGEFTEADKQALAKENAEADKEEE